VIFYSSQASAGNVPNNSKYVLVAGSSSSAWSRHYCNRRFYFPFSFKGDTGDDKKVADALDLKLGIKLLIDLLNIRQVIVFAISGGGRVQFILPLDIVIGVVGLS
jgi:hypothetical protein